MLLRRPRVWLVPFAVPAVVMVLVASIYIGSVVDPTGHLHGLAVRIVDEDTGATTSSGRVVLGRSIVQALERTAGVTRRLGIQVTTLSQAKTEMSRGEAYATLVIPRTFTSSALLDAGYPQAAGPSTPPTLTLQLLENNRLGSLGVSLAAGVLTPAIGAISKQIGAKLTAESTSAVHANRVLAAHLADPITLVPVSYRPLPSHSALGLSAFYVSLIAILAGFLGATVIHSSIDGVLGYATSDVGPRWKIRMPQRISRLQTLLTKWTVALAAAPLLTALVLAVAVGAFGMDAPNVGLLWLLLTLATAMVSAGTLALLAAFGSMGQLLAMVIIVYLSLASSGGTVPVAALPGFFAAVSAVEPLRQLLDGTRDILYFGGEWHAGLARAVVVLTSELAFWLVIGISFTSWYDSRKLYRLSPEAISYLERAAAERTET